MKARLGISNRHIHLNSKDFKILFPLYNIDDHHNKDLYQRGYYATDLYVTIRSSKSDITKVRLLGPLRDYTQVEISKTDSYKLGINPPIRESGDLEGAEVITITSEYSSITKRCCIIATRHLHISIQDKEKLHIPNVVSIKIDGEKPAVLKNIYVRPSIDANMELHLDTDDANACLLKNEDEIELII